MWEGRVLGDLWMVHSVCIGYWSPTLRYHRPQSTNQTTLLTQTMWTTHNTNDFRGNETSHEQYRMRSALNTRTWLWQKYIYGYFANDKCHIRNAFGEVTIMNARANTNGGGVVVPGRASGPCHYSKRTDDDGNRWQMPNSRLHRIIRRGGFNRYRPTRPTCGLEKNVPLLAFKCGTVTRKLCCALREKHALREVLKGEQNARAFFRGKLRW